MSRCSSYSYEDFDADETMLFDHLQRVRQSETYQQLIDRYRRLFIHGSGYPKYEIQQAVYRLAACCRAEHRFIDILNRCCYILINHWSHSPNGAEATENLVALFGETPRQNDAIMVQRLQTLVQKFRQSQQHDALLRRLSANQIPTSTQPKHDRPLRELINRFPLLYRHYLLEFDTSEGGEKVVQEQQRQRQREIEEALWRYGKPARSPHTPEAVPENPMLLDKTEVDKALRHFSYEGLHSISYHEAASQLVARSRRLPTHRAFKAQLHQELSAFVNQAYRLHNPNSRPSYVYTHQNFDRWLHQHLQSALPQHDHLPPSVSLRVKTCRHLLDMLLSPSRDRLDGHIELLDLTANLGTMLTVGLLLKIVLVCHDGDSSLTSNKAIDRNLQAIRDYLAERLAALFKQYEANNSNSEQVNWLVECLEHWMIVASIFFGRYGVSYWSTMLRGGD